MASQSEGVSRSVSATLFDLRSVIALLFVVYGIVLTIYGAVASTPDDVEKSGGIDINLWTGIVMLVVAAFFITWVLVRPPVVVAPADAGTVDEGTAGEGKRLDKA
jgi:quinol-cytochrome oxidoreductase complex cytochrome b subunit